MAKPVKDKNSYIRRHYKVLSKHRIAKDCGISENAVTHRMRRMRLKPSNMKSAHRMKKPKPVPVPMRLKLPEAKRYIITAAQNATPIHKTFWATLLQAAKYYDAELVVIPGRYKNPTSQWTQKNQKNEWWDPAVMPYLYSGRSCLNERLMLLGDIKVQWAARSPLTSLDALTKDKSGIVGHANRALRSVATPQYKHPKVMRTTGACTLRNYTDTRQGKIGASNHCLGALIVEIDEDTFHARELNADKNGCFIDLDIEFTPDGTRLAKRALSLTPGDIHQRWVLPHVIDATFDATDSIVNLLHPQYIIYNDLTDSHARNHHHNDNWVTQYGKWKFGIESVATEIEEAIRFVNEKTPSDSQAIIVSSNHDRAVNRWVKENDFRTDPVNAVFFLRCALSMAESVRKEEGGIAYDDPFITYGKKFAGKNVRFLEQGQSFVLKRVEYGLHGDLGPNGSRGTTKNLSTIGVKVTKGHSHTAEIIDGCYSSGKCTGYLEYEGGGPSSHSNAHVVQYANGKRAILFIINGRYCLPRPALPEVPSVPASE